MSERPRVMVGGPVRDRAWIVPTWLNGIIGQDYTHERLDLAVLVNDSRDRTRMTCEWWAGVARAEGFHQSQVRHISWGCQTDNNLRGGQRDYSQFARARQAWVAMRRPDIEWLFQVDSDIQLPPDCLRSLVDLATTHGVKFLAACIQNAWGAPQFAGNVLVQMDGVEGLIHHPSFLTDRRDGVFPCDLTGAVVLLHRLIFDHGLSYLLPDVAEQTEDGPFCRACIGAGYQPHYAPSVWATHWMQRPADLSYVSDPAWHRRMTAWHATEAQRLGGRP